MRNGWGRRRRPSNLLRASNRRRSCACIGRLSCCGSSWSWYGLVHRAQAPSGRFRVLLRLATAVIGRLAGQVDRIAMAVVVFALLSGSAGYTLVQQQPISNVAAGTLVPTGGGGRRAGPTTAAAPAAGGPSSLVGPLRPPPHNGRTHTPA